MDWLKCTLCPLCRSRRNVVYGEGDIEPDIFMVGEAPGKSEDLTGRPFTGPSGRVLQKALTHVCKLVNRVVTIYTTNIIACRPPGNRNPHDKEAVACRARLIEIDYNIRPRLVFLAGRIAQKYGSIVWPAHIELVHPAFLLRTGGTESPHYRGFVRRICDGLANQEKTTVRV